MRAAVLFSVIVPVLVLAEDSQKPIKPKDAAKKIDEKVVVEMEVKSSRLTDAGVCYLNSEEDFRDEDNFTVFMPKGAVEKFKTKKIDDPAKHFKGKTILVTGKVTKYKGKPQIKVNDPKSIKVKAKEKQDSEQ